MSEALIRNSSEEGRATYLAYPCTKASLPAKHEVSAAPCHAVIGVDQEKTTSVDDDALGASETGSNKPVWRQQSQHDQSVCRRKRPTGPVRWKGSRSRRFWRQRQRSAAYQQRRGSGPIWPTVARTFVRSDRAVGIARCSSARPFVGLRQTVARSCRCTVGQLWLHQVGSPYASTVQFDLQKLPVTCINAFRPPGGQSQIFFHGSEVQNVSTASDEQFDLRKLLQLGDEVSFEIKQVAHKDKKINAINVNKLPKGTIAALQSANQGRYRGTIKTLPGESSWRSQVFFQDSFKLCNCMQFLTSDVCM